MMKKEKTKREKEKEKIENWGRRNYNIMCTSQVDVEDTNEALRQA